METLLLVGRKDKNLHNFLGGLGYAIHTNESLTERSVQGDPEADLIVLHADRMPEKPVIELIESCKKARGASIVVTGTAVMHQRLREKGGLSVFVAHENSYAVGRLSYVIFEELARKRGDRKAEQQGVALSQLNEALNDLNRRHQRELEDAREIQKSLIPAKLPQHDQFELAVLYQPLIEVGGNWYGMQTLSDGRLMLQFAEVGGRGLSAAFLCSMTKLALTACGGLAPAELLGAVNRLMLTSMPKNTHVSLCIMQYQPASGDLVYAAAGHSPVLHRNSAETKVTHLPAAGNAIGISSESTYQARQITVGRGDSLLIFSRALIESMNRSSQAFGIERAAAALNAQSSSSAEDTLSHMLAEFDKFRDERLLKDDLTLLVLRRNQ